MLCAQAAGCNSAPCSMYSMVGNLLATSLKDVPPDFEMCMNSTIPRRVTEATWMPYSCKGRRGAGPTYKDKYYTRQLPIQNMQDMVMAWVWAAQDGRSEHSCCRVT